MSAELTARSEPAPLAQRSRWFADPPIAVAIGLLSAGLAWLRIPAAARDTIWAEDGPIFLHPWAVGAGWRSVLAPYDGYLHVVPRLVGGLVYGVSGVDDLAVSLSVACCVFYGIVAGLVFVYSRDVVDLLEARLMLALVTVLAPVAGWESMHNLANAHWFLLWLTPWLLLARPRSTLGAVLMSALALLIALTEVQALVFAPLVLWRWKRRASWPIYAAFVIGLIAQLLTALLNPRIRPDAASPPWTSVVAGYLLNNGMSFWDTDQARLAVLVQRFGWVIGLLALVPFLVAFGVAWWKGGAQVRTAAVTLALASVIGWTAAFVVNHDPDYYYTRLPIDAQHGLRLVRWATASSMFVIAALPLMVAALARRSRRWRIAGDVLLVAALLVMLTSLVQTGHPRGGSPWQTAVDTAEVGCSTDPDQIIDVPIQPTNWFLALPCDVLDAD